MKKELLIPILFIALLFAGSCKDKPQDEQKDSDSVAVDTQKIVEAGPDTTMWGHMGEDCTMGVMEFITEKGDTLYLERTSEATGEDGEVIGDIRNTTDRFAVVTRGKNIDEGLSIKTCINVTQMMGVWKTKTSKLALYADGTVDNGDSTYQNWAVKNGRLLLTGTIKTEYGQTQRTDTLQVYDMSDNMLTVINQHNEKIKFTK